MCCGRSKTPRRTGRRSQLIKKSQLSKNNLAEIPTELPQQPRQEIKSIKSDEEKQAEDSK